MNLLKPLYVALIDKALTVVGSLTLEMPETAQAYATTVKADGLVYQEGKCYSTERYEAILPLSDLAALAAKAEQQLEQPNAPRYPADMWELYSGPEAETAAQSCNQIAAEALRSIGIEFLVSGLRLRPIFRMETQRALARLNDVGCGASDSEPRDNMLRVLSAAVGIDPL